MATQRAYKDENDVSTWIGVSCVDATQTVRIAIDSVSGGMLTDAVTVISFTPSPSHATLRDANGVPVKTGISDASDSVIFPLYVNPANGKVLIDA